MELVYGSQTVLPGRFVSSSDAVPVADLLESFQNRLESLQNQLAGTPVRPTSHNLAAPYPLPERLPNDLLASSHVFVHRDSARPPLAPVYDGPSCVLDHSFQNFSSIFRLDVGDRMEEISSSHLKPAFVSLDTPEA